MMQTLANHLLQSTLFAAAAGILTLFLRNNHARTRYWIWLVASMKFLIPFSLFIEIGHRISWSGAPRIVQPRLAFVMNEISQPFAAPDVSASPTVHVASSGAPILPALLLAAWMCGCVAVLIFWFLRWRRVAALLRASSPVTEDRELRILRRLDARIDLISSGAQMEPGVFGITRPVLYLPAGMADHLDDAQLEAIFAHEVGHIRRRDNLTAALHMLVEAVFWFHPLVWWIGARLVEERERACDEEVVRLGSDPEVYAATILQICKLYIASPLVCAAGISGSDLAGRIEGIMLDVPLLKNMGLSKIVLLATVGALALLAPITLGILGASSSRAQAPAVPYSPAPPQLVPQTPPATQGGTAASVASRLEFESATVQPESPGVSETQIVGGPGTRYPNQIVYYGITLRRLISRAYAGEIDALTGPDWLGTDKWYIVANISPGADVNRSNLMLRNLLAERFHLVVHREARRFNGYALEVVPGAPEPQVWPSALPPALARPPEPKGTAIRAYAAAWLPGMDDETDDFNPESDAPRLIDRTGKPGVYDEFLTWAHSMMGRVLLTGGIAYSAGGDILALDALMERAIGAKVAIDKVRNIPIDVLVVDRATRITIAGKS
jgi:uncharacterized protein (TIGR03435 family)